MARIIVKVSKVGDSKIEVEGGSGTSCVDLTSGIEAALNGAVQEREYKPEYSEGEVDQTLEH